MENHLQTLRILVSQRYLESDFRGFSNDYDGESIMIDATIVRAHPCAAGYEKGQHDREALGSSKGGFATKIHAVVDDLGQALKFSLTPGQEARHHSSILSY